MHEVKVFDGTGKLKKVISVEKLNIRAKQQMEFPALFRRNKNNGKLPEKSPKNPAKKKQPKT